jgi:hypothetical protein
MDSGSIRLLIGVLTGNYILLCAGSNFIRHYQKYRQKKSEKSSTRMYPSYRKNDESIAINPNRDLIDRDQRFHHLYR